MRWSLCCSAAIALSQFTLAQFKLPGTETGGSKPKKFEDVATITAKLEPEKAKPGDTVKLHVTVTQKSGSYTYALTQPNGQGDKHSLTPPISPIDSWYARACLQWDIKLTFPMAIRFEDKIADPDGWKDQPGIDAGKMDRVYEKPVTWTITGKVLNALPGKINLQWKDTRIQVCIKDNCFYTRGNDLPELSFEVLDGPMVAIDEPATSTTTGISVNKSNEKSSDLLKFLGLAVFWGLVSLVTPCVFPMIPITVSLFLKQGNQSTGGAMKFAAVYCTTIMLVLGLSAVFVLETFKELSTNAYMNIALAAMMLIFALSLFGWFDIQLPGFLLRAAEQRRRKGGLLGTVFGALAFSIVSFTCVAPFLGGFAGFAASGKYARWEMVLAGLTFGAAFAAPFFILAMFPSMLKKLPRSGGWLDTIKAVMGFLEVAAAVGFARTAEKTLTDPQIFFTYDVCLAAYVIVSIVCGLYLLGLFRLPHDDIERKPIHVFQLMVALGFLGLGTYLMPGLLPDGKGGTHRPKGTVFAWVDAFLLPDSEIVPVIVDGKKQLPDLDSEVTRIATALKAWEDGGKKGPPPEKRLIFIDFTGETCKNCKLNEKNVFPNEPVKGLLNQYRKIDLYADTIPAAYYDSDPGRSQRASDAAKNVRVQDRFGSLQLPLYVIVEPKSDGTYDAKVYKEGAINDVPAFVEFLKKPLQQ